MASSGMSDVCPPSEAELPGVVPLSCRLSGTCTEPTSGLSSRDNSRNGAGRPPMK